MIPCERVTYTILPAVRAVLAQELSADGFTQDEIADLLNVTQPAVSQYLSRDRGEAVQRIRGNETCWETVREVVHRLSDGHVLDEEELAGICHEIAEELPPQ